MLLLLRDMLLAHNSHRWLRRHAAGAYAYVTPYAFPSTIRHYFSSISRHLRLIR